MTLPVLRSEGRWLACIRGMRVTAGMVVGSNRHRAASMKFLQIFHGVVDLHG